jgi:NADH dehydrogenase
MAHDFRHIDTRDTRVLLIEAGPRVLPTFPEKLSARAHRDLSELGVDVRLGAPVTEITREHVIVAGERIPTETVFWAAGNQASPLGLMLGAETDRAGRVRVRPDLSVPGHPEVFVAGDLCTIERPDGTPVPAVAPTANQSGTHAARNIRRILEGAKTTRFEYVHKGDLATIGRHRAVSAFGRFTITGYVSWLLWVFVHLMYLVGFRNRASVFVQWAYAYFTYQRGVRLIVGPWGGRRTEALSRATAETSSSAAV